MSWWIPRKMVFYVVVGHRYRPVRVFRRLRRQVRDLDLRTELDPPLLGSGIIHSASKRSGRW
jgi:hypothetical protein